MRDSLLMDHADALTVRVCVSQQPSMLQPLVQRRILREGPRGNWDDE
jgi:hypothetical protein